MRSGVAGTHREHGLLVEIGKVLERLLSGQGEDVIQRGWHAGTRAHSARLRATRRQRHFLVHDVPVHNITVRPYVSERDGALRPPSHSPSVRPAYLFLSSILVRFHHLLLLRTRGPDRPGADCGCVRRRRGHIYNCSRPVDSSSFSSRRSAPSMRAFFCRAELSLT